MVPYPLRQMVSAVSRPSLADSRASLCSAGTVTLSSTLRICTGCKGSTGSVPSSWTLAAGFTESATWETTGFGFPFMGSNGLSSDWTFIYSSNAKIFEMNFKLLLRPRENRCGFQKYFNWYYLHEWGTYGFDFLISISEGTANTNQ